MEPSDKQDSQEKSPTKSFDKHSDKMPDFVQRSDQPNLKVVDHEEHDPATDGLAPSPQTSEPYNIDRVDF